MKAIASLKPLLPLAAITLAAATIALASTYIPLATLTINIVPGSGTGSGSAPITVIAPASIDLGNVTAGSSGTYTTNAYIKVDKDLTVKLELENKKTLKRIFDDFKAYITIGNETYTLSLYNGYETYALLTRGEYNVTILVEYHVRGDASGSYKELVFIKIEAEDMHEHTHSYTHTEAYNHYDEED